MFAGIDYNNPTNMAGANLKWEPPKLDLSVDRYNAFKTWKDRFDDYAVVSKLEQEDPAYQCSILRYCFSEDTRKIYNTLTMTELEQKDMKIIVTKLEESMSLWNGTYFTTDYKKKGSHSTTTLQN